MRFYALGHVRLSGELLKCILAELQHGPTAGRCYSYILYYTMITNYRSYTAPCNSDPD